MVVAAGHKHADVIRTMRKPSADLTNANLSDANPTNANLSDAIAYYVIEGNGSIKLDGKALSNQTRNIHFCSFQS